MGPASAPSPPGRPVPAAADVPGGRAPRWALAVLAALGAVFLVLGAVPAVRDHPNVDEVVYLTAGLNTLQHADLRLNPEHPPLSKVLAAVVPAVVGAGEVVRTDTWARGDWFDVTDETIAAAARDGTLGLLATTGRLVPLALGVLTGFVLAALGRELFGWGSGLVAAAAFFTTPVFVGFAALDVTDLPFALAVALVAWALAYLLRPGPDGGRPRAGAGPAGDAAAALVGLATAAAILTRHTGLVVAGAAAVTVAVVAARAAGRAPGGGGAALRLALRRGGIVLGVAWLAVWALYLTLAPVAPPGAGTGILDSVTAAGRGAGALAALVLAVPWPPSFAAGFAYLVETSEPRPAFLLGQAWVGSRWWFFPASALVKLPTPALLVLLAAPAGWWTVAPSVRRRAAVALGVPALAVGLAVVAQPLNLGLRYVFPVLLLGLVAAGPVVVWATRRVAGRVVVAVAAVAQIALLASAVPAFVAWTAPPWRPGYTVAADTNLDWGQDLGRLAEWSAGRDPYLAVVAGRGWRPPPGSRDLLDVAPEQVQGWVAAGASALTTVRRDELAWLRAYCPVGTLGGTILLYRFDEPPRALRPGETVPDAPPPPCPGETSVRV